MEKTADGAAMPLRGTALASFSCLRDAYLLVEAGRIADYGPMDAMPTAYQKIPKKQRLSLPGQWVLPSWCDSHTHLVFGGSREEEFVQRIKGMSYEEIARRGGGILQSAKKTAEATEDMLFQAGWERLQRLVRMGTGALEIKSGYGLCATQEMKLLRVAKKLREKAPIPIKTTFLAAHALPASHQDRRADYLQEMKDLVPTVAREGLADYIDVFCERGFFTPEEADDLLRCGRAHGLHPKVHANQLHRSGGVQVGVTTMARSVDHLEKMGEEEIRLLGEAQAPIATLLPLASFFLRMPYAPARALIAGGATVAIGTDYNPGSAPCGNMHLAVSLACLHMGMLPEEAMNAATRNGAFAMDSQEEVGSIARGKRANLMVTQPVPSLAYIPYHFGQPFLSRVMVNGTWAHEEPPTNNSTYG